MGRASPILILKNSHFKTFLSNLKLRLTAIRAAIQWLMHQVVKCASQGVREHRLPFIPTKLLALVTISSSCAATQPVSLEREGGFIYLPLQMEIELALAAGPEHVRPEAAVYAFGKSGYRRVRAGTNGFTCLVNRDGHQNGDEALRPTCWDAEGSATVVPVMLRVGELLAHGIAADEIKQEIELGFASGNFISPRKTGIAYMLSGDVIFDGKAETISNVVFPPHYMIYAPGVSNADIGMTEAAFAGNPALPLVYDGYSGGIRTAYIIVIAADPATHGHRSLLSADNVLQKEIAPFGTTAGSGSRKAVEVN